MPSSTPPQDGPGTAEASIGPVVDLNADAGESFGRWVLGHDAELFPLVTSVSVACGFHGGDPATMRTSCRIAREHGVALGAHPGLPDLLGFGRRALQIDVGDAFDYCAYQLGALSAIARTEGVALQHVKPHGALYTMATRDRAFATALARCVMSVDDSLILVMLAGETADAAEEAGARVAREAVVDLDYDDSGQLVLEPIKLARDPEAIANRAVGIVGGSLRTVGGRELPVTADTLCIHGDGPNVLELATAIRAAFRRHGIGLGRMAEVLDSRASAQRSDDGAGLPGGAVAREETV
jgi:UPF0271 protein